MKLFSILTSVVVASSLLAAPASAASDLPTDHHFYEEITYLMDKNVVSGFTDGTVRPNQIVTRAEAAIMIGKLKGFDGTQQVSGFTDVTKGMKASGYIAAAKQAGFINGYDDGTFKPYAPITRGDMAIILANVFPSPEREISYTDMNKNMRAYYPVMILSAASIVAGYPDNTFKPQAKTTRGQFSAFLARALEPKFKNDTHAANGFMRDKTKTYTYKNENGKLSNHSYVKHTAFKGMDYGFAWQDDTAPFGFYYEVETNGFYQIDFPINNTDMDLVYPVQIGTKLYTDPNASFKAVVTGVDVTVETAYKMFTNAVEVSVEGAPGVEESGHKYYLVPGYGQVKLVQNDGVVSFELMTIK